MKILFVCHGNICRSPMAEFVMRDVAAKAGIPGLEVESAALHDDAIGCNIHGGTRRKLLAEGVPFFPRAAWRLTAKKAHEYDLVVGMDSYNMADLRALLSPEDLPKAHRLLEFAGKTRDIADPWYTGNFDETYADILEGCTALAQKITSGEIADAKPAGRPRGKSGGPGAT